MNVQCSQPCLPDFQVQEDGLGFPNVRLRPLYFWVYFGHVCKNELGAKKILHICTTKSLKVFRKLARRAASPVASSMFSPAESSGWTVQNENFKLYF